MTDFSYQLYSSRNFPTLADTLAMLAAAGYKGVEGYGALYADDAKVAELTAGLAAHHLRMPTAHFGLDMLENEPEKVLGIAKALGIETIYCPFLPPDQRPTDGAGWLAFGARLQAASEPYRAAGLGFGWHNHDFEFVPAADGVIPLEAIFEGGPDLEWEADIAWIIRGGADPMEWIQTHGRRITAVHVKDIAPEGENADEDGWADVGAGTVDWKAIMTALENRQVKAFVMEHDNPKDHARFAARSIANAKEF
ncbi:sugar phosphate isomerase/epimerase family protein [Amaricoccus solimangrovi]|uniref:Sugar phosphate isomerase/epimerase n=1 Tax=Amaricoccus solimangrovi TaxID=2589815 RepID=A0A501WJ73_9RHOB|nr:sugar phosphate isomerase/epimerase [Amaricoccus solimangrovi]TPE49559.1 sugar phosphate isomerase/epimerase [Amaricoccus solimangrovi]